MNRVKPGLLLHRSIRFNNFKKFSTLLRLFKSSINKKNKKGDTPLMLCLKLRRTPKFIERLLSAGASIVTANKEGISPLSFTIARCDHLVQLLLEKTVDSEIYERKLTRRLETVIKTIEYVYHSVEGFLTSWHTNYKLKIYVINRNLDTEKTLVRITTSNPLYNDNVTVVELNALLNQLESDDDILKRTRFNQQTVYAHWFKQFYEELFWDSILLDTATVFKSLCNRTHAMGVLLVTPALLHVLIVDSGFNNSEYIECLQFILTSVKSPHFDRYYGASLFKSVFYRDVYLQFFQRRIDKDGRMLITSRSVELMDVTIYGIQAVFSYFGFNEDVVFLIQHLRPDTLFYKEVLHFVKMLGATPQFSIDKISYLDPILKSSYLKLINCLPEEKIARRKSIKLRKKMLEEKMLPSLFEISKYVFQKSIQQFYNIQYRSEFVEVVGKMYLPYGIKNILCQKPLPHTLLRKKNRRW